MLLEGRERSSPAFLQEPALVLPMSLAGQAVTFVLPTLVLLSLS